MISYIFKLIKKWLHHDSGSFILVTLFLIAGGASAYAFVLDARPLEAPIKYITKPEIFFCYPNYFETYYATPKMLPQF